MNICKAWIIMLVISLVYLGCRGFADELDSRSTEGPWVAKQTWVDSGFSTPEATFTTYCWAGREATLKRMQECMSARDAAAFAETIDSKSTKDAMLSYLNNAWGSANAYRIMSKTNVSATHVELAFLIDGWGDKTPQRMTLKKFGSEWKIDGQKEQADEAAADLKRRQAEVAAALAAAEVANKSIDSNSE